MSSEKLHRPPTPTNYINIFSAGERGCRADEDECDSDITPSLVRVWSAHQLGSHQLIFSTNILKSNKFCFEILSTSLGFESQCLAEGEEDRESHSEPLKRRENTLAAGDVWEETEETNVLLWLCPVFPPWVGHVPPLDDVTNLTFSRDKWINGLGKYRGGRWGDILTP